MIPKPQPLQARSENQSREKRPNGSDAANARIQAEKCPRCKSLNTKFCYYNNYSLAQPRYFCKNCRRYWTKGGALRDVPEGGGCRKNKRSKQQCEARSPSNVLPYSNSFLSTVSDIAQPCPSMTNLHCEQSTRKIGQSMDAGFQHIWVPASAGILSNNFPCDTVHGLHSMAASMAVSYHNSCLVESPIQAPNPPFDLSHASVIPKLEDNHSGFNGSSRNVGSSCLALHGKERLSNGGLLSAESIPGSEEESSQSKRDCTFKEKQFGECHVSLDNLLDSASEEASLWSVSWPELHAALAGSATIAGALLH